MPVRPRIDPLRGAFASVAVLALLILSAGPAGAARPAGGDAALTFTTVLSGYSRPVLVTHTGEATRRIFIVEQTGRIRIARFVRGAWEKRGVFLDLRGKVNDPLVPGNNERGLLGLAFHPRYAENGRFYVAYTRRASGGRDGDTVVAEYRRRTVAKADPASERIVMVVDQPFANHNGGHLAFGPDGRLYIGLGDGGLWGDPGDRAQDAGSLLGKVLRIDPRDPDDAGPRRYRVPADNPYIGETEKRAEIWLSGVRNPWRFSFDRGTGDLLVGDVGQGDWEEIDWLPAAGSTPGGKAVNLGWNACEGDHAYPDVAELCDHAANGFQAPVFEYSHAPGGPADEGCSVTGGYVYRGPGAPGWRGIYLFGDFCSGKVSALAPDGTRLLTQSSGRTISSFGEDSAGRLFLVDIGGTISLVVFQGDPIP